MKFRQIEAFKTVMEVGSVTAASRSMLLTQPAVSKLISQLEWSIKMPLFVRSKGRLVPTPEADILYAEVAQTFALLANIGTVADEIKALDRGQIVVSAAPMLSNSWLPAQCVRFLEDHPGIRLNLRTEGSSSVIDAIAGGKADVGFGMMSEHPLVVGEMFAEIEAVCLLPAGHPLSKKEVLTHTDLHGQPFVHTGGLDGTRGKIEAMFTSFDVKVDARLETIAASTTCNFIAAGAGLTLVNALSALEFHHLGYEVRRFVPQLNFRVYLLVPRYRPVAMLTKAFVGKIKQSAQDELAGVIGRLFPNSMDVVPAGAVLPL